ncbi:MAG TPA: hypothetical protein VMP68_16355 [Candidatus Eisenbacteria bacterium]|nr:hypothetical protein [Candidatus Eisenbacteria bacterium]
MTPIAQDSTSPTSRLVSVYYIVTIVLGAFVLFFHGRLAFTVDLIAVVFYLAMTALFYDASKRLPRPQRPMRRN